MDEKTFLNIQSVVEFLKAEGWKAGKSSAYVHVKEGRLRTREDGTFAEKDVRKYARIFLKRLDPETLQPAAIEKLQQRRLTSETKKLEAQVRILEHREKVESGRYVLKSDFEREIALHVLIFKNDIESFCLMNAPEIIRLVQGDLNKTTDLVNYLRDKSADWLNTYSEDREWEICIDADPQQQAGEDGLEDDDGANEDD